MIWWCFLTLAVGVHGSPAFYNERQTGISNFILNLTDTNIILIPTKEITTAAINIALMGPARDLANRFFRLAGIGKTAAEEPTTLQKNTTLTPEITETQPTTSTSTETPSTSTTANPTPKKKTTRKEDTAELTLIQTGIEECGPEGHRDSLGICIYDVPIIIPK